MILQNIDSGTMFIIGLLITSILLWLMLYFSSSLIISKSYAHDKRLMLLIAAIILVLVVPLIAGVINTVLTAIGSLFDGLRDLIDGQGQNFVANLGVIVSFLLFLAILKYLCSMEWDRALWISLLGLFFLYCLYSVFPELTTFGNVI